MQPLDEGMPCHEIFECDPCLECSTLVETGFYNISKPFMAANDFVRDPLLCSIFVGTSYDADGGRVDADLKIVYTLVLPICATCRSQGAKNVVGRYVSTS